MRDVTHLPHENMAANAITATTTKLRTAPDMLCCIINISIAEISERESTGKK